MMARSFALALALQALVISPLTSARAAQNPCILPCTLEWADCFQTASGIDPSGDLGFQAMCLNQQLACIGNCTAAIAGILRFASSVAPLNGDDIPTGIGDQLGFDLAEGIEQHGIGIERAREAFLDGQAALLEVLGQLRQTDPGHPSVEPLTDRVRNAGRLVTGLDLIANQACFQRDAVGTNPPPPPADGPFVLSEVAGPVRYEAPHRALPRDLRRALRQANRAFDRGDRHYARGLSRALQRVAEFQAEVQQLGAEGIIPGDRVEAVLAALVEDTRQFEAARAVRACFTEPGAPSPVGPAPAPARPAQAP